MTGSGLGNEWGKANYCHPAYLTSIQKLASIQSASCKMLSSMNHRLESRLRNINSLRYADDTTLIGESEEELKSLLMKVKVKEESEKAGLNSTLKKLRLWHPFPSLHGN